ncbi:MAG: ferritin-like domain-containing protein [Bacillota bacterium]
MFGQKFNSVEVIEMAKDIEKRGLDFYKKQAKKTDNDELKELLLKLAEDEQEHYDTFSEMLEKAKELTDTDSDYVYSEDVSAYLRAIIEFTVFPSEEEVEEKINSIEDVLELAINAEKDSILFYREMMEYNNEDTNKILKRLVDEEKQHLLDLVKYDAELA